MVDHPSHNALARPAGRAIAASVALAPAVVFAAAVFVLNPSAQFERGLSSAAAVEARIMAANSTTSQAATVASRAFEEGSEGFWLTRAPEAENVAHVSWNAPVAAGDRVVVNFGANDRQILDVVSVEEAGASATRIDTGVGKTGHYIVTGRRLASPSGDLIRFTVDAQGRGLTMITGAHDRAL